MTAADDRAAVALLSVNAFVHGHSVMSLSLAAFRARLRIETHAVVDKWESWILSSDDAMAGFDNHPTAALEALLAPYLMQARALIASGQGQIGFMLGAEASDIIRTRFHDFALRRRAGLREILALSPIDERNGHEPS